MAPNISTKLSEARHSHLNRQPICNKSSLPRKGVSDANHITLLHMCLVHACVHTSMCRVREIALGVLDAAPFLLEHSNTGIQSEF